MVSLITMHKIKTVLTSELSEWKNERMDEWMNDWVSVITGS